MAAQANARPVVGSGARERSLPGGAETTENLRSPSAFLKQYPRAEVIGAYDGQARLGTLIDPIREWCRLSSMGRTRVYEEAGLGNLRTIKVGGRSLFDLSAGLAWLDSQPPAPIAPARLRRHSQLISE